MFNRFLLWFKKKNSIFPWKGSTLLIFPKEWEIKCVYQSNFNNVLLNLIKKKNLSKNAFWHWAFKNGYDFKTFPNTFSLVRWMCYGLAFNQKLPNKGNFYKGTFWGHPLHFVPLAQSRIPLAMTFSKTRCLLFNFIQMFSYASL